LRGSDGSNHLPPSTDETVEMCLLSLISISADEWAEAPSPVS
jgi:hypothetical protein